MGQESEHVTFSEIAAFRVGVPLERQKSLKKKVARICGRHSKANRLASQSSRELVVQDVLDVLFEYLLQHPTASVEMVTEFVNTAAAKYAKRMRRKSLRERPAGDGENAVEWPDQESWTPEEEAINRQHLLVLFRFLQDSIADMGPVYGGLCQRFLDDEALSSDQRTRVLSELRHSMLRVCEAREADGQTSDIFKDIAAFIELASKRGSQKFPKFVQELFQTARMQGFAE